MKHFKIYIYAILLMGVSFLSCHKDTVLTMGEFLERQGKLIQSFIEKEQLDILSEYPENRTFGEKQFVLLANGCYLHVVDSGIGNRAIHGHTAILMQCRAINLLTGETLTTESGNPIRFTFGKAREVISALPAFQKSPSPEYTFLSEAVESALNFVRENAKIRMIVPFMVTESLSDVSVKPVAVGSLYQNNSRDMVPFYYDEIVFQFDES